MTKLEKMFELKVKQSCIKTINFGYFPSIFLQMLSRYGAVLTAKRLVKNGDIQTGLKKLKEVNRLDLSLEHDMLTDEFVSLFDNEEIKAAKWRLSVIDTF